MNNTIFKNKITGTQWKLIGTALGLILVQNLKTSEIKGIEPLFLKLFYKELHP